MQSFGGGGGAQSRQPVLLGRCENVDVVAWVSCALSGTRNSKRETGAYRNMTKNIGIEEAKIRSRR